jgi:hypothetical protein
MYLIHNIRDALEGFFLSASTRRNWASPLRGLSVQDRATRLVDSGDQLGRKIRAVPITLLAITGSI